VAYAESQFSNHVRVDRLSEFHRRVYPASRVRKTSTNLILQDFLDEESWHWRIGVEEMASRVFAPRNVPISKNTVKGAERSYNISNGARIIYHNDIAAGVTQELYCVVRLDVESSKIPVNISRIEWSTVLENLPHVPD